MSAGKKVEESRDKSDLRKPIKEGAGISLEKEYCGVVTCKGQANSQRRVIPGGS